MLPRHREFPRFQTALKSCYKQYPHEWFHDERWEKHSSSDKGSSRNDIKCNEWLTTQRKKRIPKYNPRGGDLGHFVD